MTLRFSDGENFDTSGSLRPQRRRDGWYVVGEGMLIPVASLEEAKEYIEERQNQPREKSGDSDG